MTSQNDDITDNDIPAVDITATAARSTTVSLLHLIQQQWSPLLAGEKLAVMLTAAALASDQRYEIYLGDEFILNDVRHIDVVIRAPISDALPAVLVFEKNSAQLVQHELNGLTLETVVTVVSSPDYLLPVTLCSATSLPETPSPDTLPAIVTSKVLKPEPVAAEVTTRRHACCADWRPKRNATAGACQRRY